MRLFESKRLTESGDKETVKSVEKAKEHLTGLLSQTQGTISWLTKFEQALPKLEIKVGELTTKYGLSSNGINHTYSTHPAQTFLISFSRIENVPIVPEFADEVKKAIESLVSDAKVTIDKRTNKLYVVQITRNFTGKVY